MSFADVSSNRPQTLPLLVTPPFHSNSTSSASLADKRLPMHFALPASSARQRVQEHARREFSDFSRTSGEKYTDESENATESTAEDVKGNVVGSWSSWTSITNTLKTTFVKIINRYPLSERLAALEAARQLDPGLSFYEWSLDNPTSEPSEFGSDAEDQDTFPTGYVEPIAKDNKLSDENQPESRGDFIAELGSFVGNLEEEVRELRSQLWWLQHSSTPFQGPHEELAAEVNSLCWTYIQSEPPSPVTADFSSAEMKPSATLQRSKSCSQISSILEPCHLTCAKRQLDQGPSDEHDYEGYVHDSNFNQCSVYTASIV